MQKANRLNCLLLLGIASLMTGCSTVSETSDEIAIRHSAQHSLLVEGRAEDHCAQFGKKARLVQRSPISSELFVQTVVSTYHCVE